MNARKGHHQHAEDSLHARLVSLLRAAIEESPKPDVRLEVGLLKPERLGLGPGAVHPVQIQAAREKPASVDAPAPCSAAHAARMIERIEAFVKSGRPGITLSLREPWPAEIQLERTGPSRINIFIRGRALPPEGWKQVQRAMRARGIELCAPD
jgi:hypothetical protein